MFTAKAIILTLFYLLLFNFLIYRFKKLQLKNFKPFVTLALFNLKFIVGLLIWAIYTFYYTDIENNDVHKFYNDALVLHDVARESPKDFMQIVSGIGSHDEHFEKHYAGMKNWRRNFDEAPFNENQTIIRLNALLMFVSGQTYFVHILFMCFISLVGWVLLTNSILSFTDSRNTIFALPVLLLPSVLFWTSGVMKEPLLVLGLGLFFAGILSTGIKRFVVSGLAVTIILLTKFFVLACLLPAVLAFFLFKHKESRPFILAKYIAVNIVLLLLALNIHYIVPRIHLQQMLVNKQTHSIKEAEYFNAGSRIDIMAVTPDAMSVVKAIPAGIWNTIFRPYVWEGKNIMMLASAAENVAIILLMAFCVWYADFKNSRQLNLVLFLLSFALAYFTLIGICTPVLGNLVRYKAPLLPVFLYAFVLVVKSRPLPAILNSLRA